jgi:outer membrane lipoprotein-sorting protein
MIRPCRLALAIALGCVVSAAIAAPVARDAELDELLARFDRVQETIETLSAEFTETTESNLLVRPMERRGLVYLTKPDAVRWEYVAPEEMRFVIRDDQYVGYFPAQKRAERRDVHRWSEQLFRLLGLGQPSAELAQFYDIRLGEGSAELPGTRLLVLDPKKRRVRKRMDAVRLWIDESSYLPVRIEYVGTSGNRRLIEFDRVQLNPELSASLYTLDLPADVQVTKGFSAISGFNESEPK